MANIVSINTYFIDTKSSLPHYTLNTESIEINLPYCIINLNAESNKNILYSDVSSIDITRINVMNEYNNYSFISSNFYEKSFGTLEFGYSEESGYYNYSQTNNYTFISLDPPVSPVYYNVSTYNPDFVGFLDLDNRISYEGQSLGSSTGTYTGLYGSISSDSVSNIFSEPRQTLSYNIRTEYDDNTYDYYNDVFVTGSSSPITENIDNSYNLIWIDYSKKDASGNLITSKIFTFDISKIDTIASILPSSYRVIKFSNFISEIKDFESSPSTEYGVVTFNLNSVITPHPDDFGRTLYIVFKITAITTSDDIELIVDQINFLLIPTEFIYPIIQIWDNIDKDDDWTIEKAINETYVLPINITAVDNEYDRFFIVSQMYNYISVLDGYFLSLSPSVRISSPITIEYIDGTTIQKQTIGGIILKDDVPQDLINVYTDRTIFNNKWLNLLTLSSDTPIVWKQNISSGTTSFLYAVYVKVASYYGSLDVIEPISTVENTEPQKLPLL